jgi:ribosomal protein S24E
LQAEKKLDSKVLDRAYIEVTLQGRGGKLTRKEAIEAAANELGVAPENVGLIRIDGQSGTTDVVGKFYVYGTPESKKRLHPRHLGVRLLTKEEREKIKQEKKKAAAPAPAPEAKK